MTKFKKLLAMLVCMAMTLTFAQSTGLASTKITVKSSTHQVGTKDDALIDYLSSGEYYEYTSGYDSLEYALADVSGDGINELLIQATDEAPFYTTWVFAIVNSEIICASEQYGYGQYTYSPQCNAIIGSPEFKPSNGAGDYPFYELHGTKLEWAFSIAWDEDNYFYIDSDGEELIGEHGYSYYFEDQIYFDWKKIDHFNSKQIKSWNGHKYQIFDTSLEWNEAKEYCETLGGHLATITSEDEQLFVESLLDNCDMNLLWIGLYEQNGNWQWATNEQYGFENWAEGEPNRDFNDTESVTQIYAKDYDEFEQGEWNDSRIDGGTAAFYNLDYTGFICEWDDVSLNNNDTPQNDDTSISVVLNGNKLQLTQPPVIVNGTTLVHIRTFENIGATVDWDNNTQTATVKKGNRIIKAQIGQFRLNINGNDSLYTGLAPVQLINGYTMVPLRIITEALGGVVNWKEETKTVEIYYSDIIDYILENSVEKDTKSNSLFLTTEPTLDARKIFSYYEYCYDYMDKYYSNDFWTAFSIAFDDPYIPVETLIGTVFDYSKMPDYRNKRNLDLSEIYAKNNVADCLAEAIDNLADDELDLYKINEQTKNIVSKMKSVTGLVLSENKDLESVSIFSEFLRGMGDGIKIINTSSDIVEGALTDYAVSKEYLQAFGAALDDVGLMSETLSDAIAQLELEYNAWFIKQFEDIISNKATNKITDGIGKAIGKGSYSFVNFVREALNIMSNNDDRAKLLKKINSYMIYSLPLSRCYTYYAQKIYDGDYTVYDVLQCEKVFDLCKATRIAEYKAVISLDIVDRDSFSYDTRFPTRHTELGMSEEEMLRDGIAMLENTKYSQK